MTSFNLNYLLRGPYLKYDHPGFGLQHMNLEDGVGSREEWGKDTNQCKRNS